jgi:hypothetical protein
MRNNRSSFNVIEITTNKKGENTNVVDLSKKRCFHGGAGIDNEVIWLRHIRRGGLIVDWPSSS